MKYICLWSKKYDMAILRTQQTLCNNFNPMTTRGVMANTPGLG